MKDSSDPANGFSSKGILIFLAAGAVLLASSCKQQGPMYGEEGRDKAESRIHRLDTMLFSTPSTVEINPDSLIRKPVQERKVKAGEPEIIEYTGVQTFEVKLSKPLIIHDLVEITPGSDSIPIPETFRMWKTKGDAFQEGDSIHIIKTVAVSQPLPVQAEAPRFRDNAACDLRYLDMEQGLASSYINSVLEDRRGILWMGTSRGGLSRFDGCSFLNYTPAEGLIDDIVKCLTEDLHGNIWFGTYKGGVGKFDGKVFTRYGQWEGFSPHPVNRMLADSGGNIWASTWRDGIFRINPGTDDIPYETVTRFTTDNGLISNWVITVMEDRKGNFWIGTRDGLCWYDGKSFMHLTAEEGLSHNLVISLLEDKQGDIWIGTRAGLNRLTVKEGNGVENYILAKFSGTDGLLDGQIEAIREDSKGNLWFGIFGGGVVAFDGESLRLYDDEIGLSNNYVRDMTFDSHENLWIATAGGGVNKLNPNSFHHVYNKQVHSTLEDSRGNIWLGTRHDGILKFEGDGFLKYSVEQGLSDDRVYPIMEDSKGNIWAGTFRKGVNVFDGQYFTQISEDEGLSNNFVISLLEDEQGDILIGTNGGGLNKYDGTHLTNTTERNGFYCNFDGTIIPEGPGKYWMCGLGINWTDGRIIRRHTLRGEKEVSLEVWSSLVDRNQNLWLTTMAEGVLLFSPDKNTNDGSGSFEVLNEEAGLLSNTVWSVTEDTRGDIWICTERGLNILSPTPGHGTDTMVAPGLVPKFRDYRIFSLLREDGLKGLSFCPNSSYLDGRNRMWLGGIKALSVIDLNTFSLPDRPPRLALSSIEIDQQPMDFRKIQESSAANMNGRSNMQFSGVADFYNYPLDLELPFGMNNITFHFSAIDWAAPHKISYQYRLEGFDRKWSPVTEDNEAVYRKLGPGSYTFEVRAIGAADIWSETVSYSFVVHPPVYKTTFAFVNYGLLFLLFIYGLVRWRTRRIMKERDELELQVRERTREIEHQKEEIEQQKDHILETNEELTTLNEAISKQNNEIIDSINYAQRIQAAMLPPETYVSELLNENFILYKPRDIVSGDFYWIKQVNQYIVLVAADCTGHGVPGAFMSMLGMSYLNEIVQRREITQANQVLNELRKQVKYSLRQHGLRDESKDGMDMALCVIDLKSMQMQYTGAHNPLYLIKDVNGMPELNEIKADQMPIGYYHGKDRSFVNHDIQLELGDTFYIFSDGFIDQKGGPDNKKYMSKNFKNLLLGIHDQPMFDQKEILDKKLSDWIGNNSQMDDILVIGVRV